MVSVELFVGSSRIGLVKLGTGMVVGEKESGIDGKGKRRRRSIAGRINKFTEMSTPFP